MKTTEEKLQEAKEKYGKEQHQILREGDIRAILAPVQTGYEECSIHFYRLYGATGTIHFTGTRYSSLKNDGEKAPDVGLLRSLLAQFPPIPALLVKNGCASFRPKTPGAQEEIGERAEVSEVFGVTVNVKVFQGPTTEFHWYAELPSTEVWCFQVSYPFHQTAIGKLDVIAKYYGGHDSGKISSYERCKLYPADSDAQVIRWASGGQEYPNSFTVYWDRDSGAALDFAKMVKE